MSTSVLILLSVLALGQLNPVNNLMYEYWYNGVSVCPSYNCFSLDWDEPDVSAQDTLVGYNIYRDSELWRFQDYLGVGCSEAVPDCPDASFINLDNFWMKVKAVYNTAHLESPAIDSALFSGILITGIEIAQKENGIIYPNPTNGIVKIDLEGIRKIIVINASGTKIIEQVDKSLIDLCKYSNGIYYIKIITDKEIRIEKVVLE